MSSFFRRFFKRSSKPVEETNQVSMSMITAVVATIDEQILAELILANQVANRNRKILRSIADDVRTATRVVRRMLPVEFTPDLLPERDPEKPGV